MSQKCTHRTRQGRPCRAWAIRGTDPVYAAIYQFVVIAMLFAASGLTSLACTRLIRLRAFSPAQQLLLRPEQQRSV